MTILSSFLNPQSLVCDHWWNISHPVGHHSGQTTASLWLVWGMELEIIIIIIFFFLQFVTGIAGARRADQFNLHSIVETTQYCH